MLLPFKCAFPCMKHMACKKTLAAACISAMQPRHFSMLHYSMAWTSMHDVAMIKDVSCTTQLVAMI